MILADTNVRHTTKADGYGVNCAAGTSEDPFEAASDIAINKIEQKVDSDFDSVTAIKFTFQYSSVSRPLGNDRLDVCARTAENE